MEQKLTFGARVKHKTYGKGYIIEYNYPNCRVKFDNIREEPYSDNTIWCEESYLELVEEVTTKTKDSTMQTSSSLRDQFAMAALTGILSRSSCPYDSAAEYSYGYADEMLKIRG